MQTFHIVISRENNFGKKKSFGAFSMNIGEDSSLHEQGNTAQLNSDHLRIANGNHYYLL